MTSAPIADASNTHKPNSPLTPAALMSAARDGAAQMRACTVTARIVAVKRLIDYLQSNEERLLDALVDATGRCRTDAMISDLFQLLEDLRWLTDNSQAVLADEEIKTPLSLLGKKSRIYYEPHGVALVIAPWNLPLAIPLTAGMFAFIAGNAVIIKPSEHTPMTTIFEEIRSLHPLFEKALLICQGEGTLASEIIDQRPDFISFTGSLPTGKKILAQASQYIIPVSLELGAKDAMVVFEDADIRRAVSAASWGNMHNNGQSCTAIERLLLQESIAEDFVTHLKSAFAKVRIGTTANAELGRITTSFQLEKIQRLVKDAVQKGATLVMGGDLAAEEGVYLPTILTDIDPSMNIYSEEIFGPVLCVETFRSEEQAIALHNALPLGLSASVWSMDLNKADRVGRALETGCININNTMLTEGNPGLPFGGVKLSGFGRIKGVEGLRAYVRSKAILIDKTTGQSEPNWYPYSNKKLTLLSGLLKALLEPWSFGKAKRLIVVGLRIELIKERFRKP